MSSTVYFDAVYVSFLFKKRTKQSNQSNFMLKLYVSSGCSVMYSDLSWSVIYERLVIRCICLQGKFHISKHAVHSTSSLTGQQLAMLQTFHPAMMFTNKDPLTCDNDTIGFFIARLTKVQRSVVIRMKFTVKLSTI